MSSSALFNFQEAGHPEIDMTYPCPSEWQFSEGELVSIKSSKKRGIIKTIEARSAEVELETGEGLVNVPWFDLQKYIATGDFTEVTSRPLWGEKRSVVAVHDEMVQIGAIHNDLEVCI